MNVEVWPDNDTAAAAAAELLATWLGAAIDERGSASLALSGGSTPLRMLEELAKADLPWAAVHLFQVDERLAPEKHEARNLTLLRERFLAHVSLPSSNFHPMPIGLPSLTDAVERYERALRDVAGSPPVLDAVHLGLGTDGHTASLFSNDPALEVDDADVTATGPHGGWRRLTLTLPVLRRARHIVWLVTGADKAQALAKLLTDGDVPAALVDVDAGVLIADRAAAARVVPD